jgi:uncharacterized protein
MLNIDDVLSEIVNRLRKLNLNKVILFGSYANSTPNENSDIDLYIITEDDFIPQNWREKMTIKMNIIKSIQDLKLKYDFEIIVHTKAMYRQFKAGNSLFAREILENGRTLLG